MFLYLIEPFPQFGNVHRGKFRDILVPDTVGEGFAVESLTVALWTFTFCQKLVGPFLSGCGVVVVHHTAEVFDNTVESREIVAGCMHQFLLDADVLQGTVEDFPHGLVGDILDGGVEVIIVFLQQGVNLPEDHLVFVLAKGNNAALTDGLFAVGDDFFEVYLVDDA